MPAVKKSVPDKRAATDPAEDFIILPADSESECESEVSDNDDDKTEEVASEGAVANIADHMDNAETSKIRAQIEETLGSEVVAETTAGGKRKKVKKVKGENLTGKRGVVYLGHIPSGFYEEEMKAFFGQFGSVTKVKLMRSRKTANSKGYGYIEFEHEEVADIVASAMNNYLLFERVLQCKRVPEGEVTPVMFKGHDKKFKKVDWLARERFASRKPKTAERVQAITANLLKKERKHRAKLVALGIDYEYPGYTAEAATKPEATVTEQTSEKAPEKTPKAESAPTPNSTKKSSGKTAKSNTSTPTTQKAPAQAAKKTPTTKKAPTPSPAPAAGKRKATPPSASKSSKKKKSSA
ncbi:hypothetical protein SARC_03136 [Sphaeroforma arctica JP610]|uniref:RRM domain-containing protein n=1 Tax=Sphaeroforma arctica JP610 TaxID=667725 RepID=A0A0L0G6K3_9EUKA|nr:hypothetical protein SARC_03136 [Sphaeroforma arctica JP610]KNC84645.1 hypothetical protein SARC_03136 [Sphaeroforma arctica JP610]|eukprot:XP_014158547.1 hypothetical protein SARC_03136 [Sphaeroforma arctica JP610]